MGNTTGTVTVRYFAAAADAAGRATEIIELEPGATLGHLVDELVARHGDEMKRVLSVAAYLRGDELTRDLTSLVGVQVDVLPPFAGG
ncbi:MoaD/ThiS family protein [Rhodococcus pyridinivorans]|uniref:MoaD/ThiS family protein n=1 Tax=Rhodococcus pyridinivorans TaxID=103816 RepID=UPI0020C5CD36|nr:MoaD/ThiS family protein [Rhodococcus pyridinivorans]UTM38013.1 MoaD/ThiS family protein [Rhodococcus pyridinivorans]